MKLTVIVPMLNEARVLPQLLAQLQRVQADGHQLLLVDGGSNDGSAQQARTAGFQVIESARGRARQMNAGVEHACGDVLLFLHADTRLPADYWPAIQQGLAQGNRVWGRFDVSIEGRPWMLRVVSLMINLRSRLSGIATGDQAMFVKHGAFIEAGRFADLPLMEDIDLSQRLLRVSRPLCLRQRVITSGRRWETRGVWTTIFLMWRLRYAYWRGVPASELAKAYS